MLAVEIALIPPEGHLVSPAKAEAARDALWAHANSFDITHITAISRQRHIDVTIFIRSGSVGPEAALSTVQKLVSVSPAFDGWTVRRHGFDSR